MTDRELLEAAAKAAGMRVNFHPAASYVWNPLTDDGDALRLAVQLDLFDAISRAYCYVSDTVDIYAATRLAIVDAAAAIGKTR